jgi:cell wall assembly regulator SMI1
VLTPELLERLERCWRQQQVPWLDSLRPGLTAAELDRILAPFDHAVPSELRLWWGWRNAGPEATWIANATEMVFAEASVRGYKMMREIAQEASDPDTFWAPTWLPVFGTGSSPTFAIDCADGEPRHTGLIYYQDSHPNHQTGFIAAASLGDVVHQLCEAYEAGLQRWDLDRGRWVQTRWGERRPFGF